MHSSLTLKLCFYTTIVASLINIILTVYLFIVQNASLHYKAKIDANISDDLADTYENKSYIKSLKVRFIYNAINCRFYCNFNTRHRKCI